MAICSYVKDLPDKEKRDLAYYLSLLYAIELYNKGEYARLVDFIKNVVPRLEAMGITATGAVDLAALAAMAVRASILRDLEDDLVILNQLLYEIKEAMDNMEPSRVDPSRLPSNVSSFLEKLRRDVNDALANGLISNEAASKILDTAKVLEDVGLIKKILVILSVDIPKIESLFNELSTLFSKLQDVNGSPSKEYSQVAYTLSRIASIAREIERITNSDVSSLSPAHSYIGKELSSSLANVLSSLGAEATYIRKFSEEVASAYQALADFFKFLENEYNPSKGVYPGIEPYHSRLANDIYQVIENAYSLLRLSDELERESRIIRKVFGETVPESLVETMKSLSSAADTIGTSLLKLVDQLYVDLGSRNNDFKKVIEEGANRAGYILPPIESSPVKDFERYLDTWIERFQATGAYLSDLAKKSSGLSRVLAELASIDSYLASYLLQMVPTPEALKAGAEFIKSLIDGLEKRSLDEIKKYMEPIAANKESLIAFALAAILTSLAIKGISEVLRKLNPRIASVFDALVSLGYGDPLGVTISFIRTLSSRELGSAAIMITGEKGLEEIRQDIARQLIGRGVSEEAAYQLAKEIADSIRNLVKTYKYVDLEKLSDALYSLTKRLKAIDTRATLAEIAQDLAELRRDLESMVQNVDRAASYIGRSLEEIGVLSESFRPFESTIKELERLAEDASQRISRLKESLGELARLYKAKGLDEAAEAIASLEKNLAKLLARENPSSILSIIDTIEASLKNIDESLEQTRTQLLSSITKVINDLKKRVATSPEARRELSVLAKLYDDIKEARTVEDLVKAAREAEKALVKETLTPEILSVLEAFEEAVNKLLSNKKFSAALHTMLNSMKRIGLLEAAKPLAEEAESLSKVAKDIERLVEAKVSGKEVEVLPPEGVNKLLDDIGKYTHRNKLLEDYFSKVTSFLENHKSLSASDMAELAKLLSDAVKRALMDPGIDPKTLASFVESILRDIASYGSEEAKRYSEILKGRLLDQIRGTIEREIEEPKNYVSAVFYSLSTDLPVVGKDVVNYALTRINELIDKYPNASKYLSSLSDYLEGKNYLTAKTAKEFLDKLVETAKRISQDKSLPRYEILSALSDIAKAVGMKSVDRLTELVDALSSLHKAKLLGNEELVSRLRMLVDSINSDMKIPKSLLEELKAGTQTKMTIATLLEKDVKDLANLLTSHGLSEEANLLLKDLSEIEDKVSKGEPVDDSVKKLLKDIARVVKKLRTSKAKELLRAVGDKISKILSDRLGLLVSREEYKEISKLIEELSAELKQITSGKGAIASLRIVEETFAIEKAPSEALKTFLDLVGRTETYRVGDVTVTRSIEIRDGKGILVYKVDYGDGHWIKIVEEIKKVGKNKRLVSERVIADPYLLSMAREKGLSVLADYLNKAREVVESDKAYSLFKSIVVNVGGKPITLADLVSLGMGAAINTIMSSSELEKYIVSRAIPTASLPGIVSAELRKLGVHISSIYESTVPGINLIITVPSNEYGKIVSKLKSVEVEIKTPTGIKKILVPIISINGYKIGILPTIPRITLGEASMPRPSIPSYKTGGVVKVKYTPPGPVHVTISKPEQIQYSITKEKQEITTIPSYSTQARQTPATITSQAIPSATRGAGGFVPPLIVFPNLLESLGRGKSGKGAAKPEILVI